MQLVVANVTLRNPIALPTRGQWTHAAKFVAQVSLATLVLLSAHKLTSLLALPNITADAIWFPSGLGVGIVMVGGYRYLPAVFIGTFLNCRLSPDPSLGPALAGGFADFMEAGVAVGLVRWRIPGRNPFSRTRDLLKFMFLAAAVGPAVGATVGVTLNCVLGVSGWNHYFPAWPNWWLENMAGVIVAAPLVITWASHFPSFRRMNWQIGGKFLVFLVSLCIVDSIVFGVRMPQIVKNYPLEYLSIPFLIWAAFRFGERGTSLAIFLTTILCVLGTQNAHGPFHRASISESLYLVQMYIGTNTLFSLMIVSVLAERRRIEQKLYQSNQQLKRFVYLASHDLQEPLRTVSGFCGLIEKRYRGKLDPQGDEYISFAVSGANRMHRLISSLLEYSGAGENLVIETTDLNLLLKQVCSNLDSLIEETKTQLRAEKMPTVPADGRLLTLVFQNLICNAIKFRGETAPEVSILAQRRPRHWLFTVQDNGPGIEEKYFQKIFGLFERVNSCGREGKGAGLATCKKIIEEHGGRMWVESEVGYGSAFRFTLPV